MLDFCRSDICLTVRCIRPFRHSKVRLCAPQTPHRPLPLHVHGDAPYQEPQRASARHLLVFQRWWSRRRSWRLFFGAHLSWLGLFPQRNSSFHRTLAGITRIWGKGRLTPLIYSDKTTRREQNRPLTSCSSYARYNGHHAIAGLPGHGAPKWGVKLLESKYSVERSRITSSTWSHHSSLNQDRSGLVDREHSQSEGAHCQGKNHLQEHHTKERRPFHEALFQATSRHSGTLL